MGVAARGVTLIFPPGVVVELGVTSRALRLGNQEVTKAKKRDWLRPVEFAIFNMSILRTLLAAMNQQVSIHNPSKTQLRGFAELHINH
jgi:hypothetical protein